MSTKLTSWKFSEPYSQEEAWSDEDEVPMGVHWTRYVIFKMNILTLITYIAYLLSRENGE